MHSLSQSLGTACNTAMMSRTHSAWPAGEIGIAVSLRFRVGGEVVAAVQRAGQSISATCMG